MRNCRWPTFMRRSAGEFDRQADEAAAQVRAEEAAAAGRSGSGRLHSGLAAVRRVCWT